MLGLYMEFSHPGAVFPGVAGMICLLLALLASQVLPINSVGLSLAILGLAFLAGERLTPSFGILGLGGLLAITLGSLFLYTPGSGLKVDRALIAATVGIMGTIVSAIIFLFVSDRRRRPRTGAEGLVDEVGRTTVAIEATGSGTVLVHGEIWTAVSEESLAKDVRIRIVKVLPGLRLQVVRDQDR